MTVAVSNADIEGIATTIWGTLFDLPFERADSVRPGTDSTVTSVVHIDGAWHGAVTIRCSMDLAHLLTAAMFQTGGEPSVDEIRDALGELANMLAGNVKALLPDLCGISLPAVAFGSDYVLSVVGAVPIATVSFACAGHPLVVTLLHRSSERSGG